MPLDSYSEIDALPKNTRIETALGEVAYRDKNGWWLFENNDQYTTTLGLDKPITIIPKEVK